MTLPVNTYKIVTNLFNILDQKKPSLKIGNTLRVIGFLTLSIMRNPIFKSAKCPSVKVLQTSLFIMLIVTSLLDGLAIMPIFFYWLS